MNKASPQTSIVVNNLHQQIINSYFSHLNDHNFEEVANLFSLQGHLYPPFEKGICGRAAIRQYLEKEAIGLQAFPQSINVQPNSTGYISNEDSQIYYQIIGYVKTSFFTVNVGWSIQLNSEQEIVSVEVKLLAELQELLGLKVMKIGIVPNVMLQ